VQKILLVVGAFLVLAFIVGSCDEDSSDSPQPSYSDGGYSDSDCAALRFVILDDSQNGTDAQDDAVSSYASHC
jgi:hypothetical protein